MHLECWRPILDIFLWNFLNFSSQSCTRKWAFGFLLVCLFPNKCQFIASKLPTQWISMYYGVRSWKWNTESNKRILCYFQQQEPPQGEAVWWFQKVQFKRYFSDLGNQDGIFKIRNALENLEWWSPCSSMTHSVRIMEDTKWKSRNVPANEEFTVLLGRLKFHKENNYRGFNKKYWRK